MLVSPGLEITVTDESQYVSTAVGTVPFVLIATEQDKLFNGTVAPYTTKANAGKLLGVTSQRDLITNLGYPKFQVSSAGTPIHGSEINEYGLMAAYSSLGSVNRMYLIRADIDLAQLDGTAVRPIGDPANGTHWLDLTDTSWGIYEWNAVTQEFVNRIPLVLTSPASTFNDAGVLTPVATVGQIGSYAVVAASPNNYIFYKRADGVWVMVGSTGWQEAFPTVTGTVASPTITPSGTITINTTEVTMSGTTVTDAAADINAANIAGVTAAVVGNKIALYATSLAESNGATADGKITIVDGTSTPGASMGLTAGTYACPALSYGTYVQVPDWRTLDSTPRPTSSVWAKTSTLGAGASFAVNKYEAENDVWTPVPATIYENEAAAAYAMDPYTGGFSIPVGAMYVRRNQLGNNTLNYRLLVRATQGATVKSGTAPVAPMAFTPGNSFSMATTVSGSSTLITTTIVLSGTTAESFVSDVLLANVPEVDIRIEESGAITFLHTQGGYISLLNVAGTPLTTAGFTTNTVGIRVPSGSTNLVLSNFDYLTYTYSTTQPYTAPTDGTLWYYDSPLECDVMISDTTGWKGYKNVSVDARGYNLQNTDPAGQIMATDAPVTQSDLTALVPGDLWIDTNDLDNFPVIYRYTATNKWQLIDNSDIVTSNGIVFADARWDTDGTTDPAAGAFTEISTMLTSNYIDLDCPDYRLYPRGTLLFNLRRSGYNVKQYVSDYFNENAYPDDTLPDVKATWVTASGLKNDGSPYTGSKAQRQMVVKAMRAALDGSEAIREESFAFNLIVAPGYPELISNMVLLNNDRKNTAFVIGDVPMDLPATITDITAWSTNSNGDGLSTADPYMAVYYPGGALANDLDGNTIVQPQSHTILRCALKSDNVSYPWFAFAGTRRGLIDNATDIGYVDNNSGSFVRNGINQGLRDALYELNMNPVTLLPGVGLVNFGNKTRQGFESSMDRVNVARLVNYIRTILAHVGDGFLFEPNDTITRNQIRQVISSALNDLIAKRGVYDYLVICDETNNDSGRIARNELYVDIAIEPMKSVEFIYIPIRLKNPGGIAAGGK
jgi:hypothetical protein